MFCVISGDFFGSEDCGFSLYPVFADGEGEAVHTTGKVSARRSFPAAVTNTFQHVFYLLQPPEETPQST